MLSNSSRALRRISVSAALFCILVGQTSAFAAAVGHNAPAPAPAPATSTGGSGGGGGGHVVVEDVILQPPSDNVPPRHPHFRHPRRLLSLDACPLNDPRCHENELDD
jgi:hypothetical protein